MTSIEKDFYRIIKDEGLDKYNIGDSKESCGATNTIGVIEDGDWIVFETDERATFHALSKHKSQEEAYSELLKELRNRKRKDNIMNNLSARNL